MSWSDIIVDRELEAGKNPVELPTPKACDEAAERFKKLLKQVAEEPSTDWRIAECLKILWEKVERRRDGE